jgi:hypothetical protein
MLCTFSWISTSPGGSIQQARFGDLSSRFLIVVNLLGQQEIFAVTATLFVNELKTSRTNFATTLFNSIRATFVPVSAATAAPSGE